METVVTALALVFLALITATGMLDFMFVNYGPGYVNGKFKWWKKTTYQKRPSRIMLTVLQLVGAVGILAVEFLGFPIVAAITVYIILAVVYMFISVKYIERD